VASLEKLHYTAKLNASIDRSHKETHVSVPATEELDLSTRRNMPKFSLAKAQRISSAPYSFLKGKR
jgi:hypothetical protein